MKKLLLTTMAALMILFAQAQTLCDYTYTTGSQYQLDVAIGVTGNGLPMMAPLYAVTYGDGNMLAEDSCFSGPCTHMVLNYNPNGAYYDTLTTCISYTLTDTVGYVDTLMCCFSQYWDGSSWAVSGGASAPSWDCGTTGCYDPGTGIGQYTTLAACQVVCASTVSNLCDSMIVNGSLNQPIFEVVGVNTFIDYWVTTSNDGVLFQEDSMSAYHMVYNFGTPAYDTLTTCITYGMGTTTTCCVEWIWDANSGLWAKMGSVTSIGEIDLFDKKLIKVVDVLGREISINSNQTLFFIYEDGTIEKRYIIDRK